MSLRWRVFAAFLVILATLLGVFAAWTSSTLTESYRQVVLERLQFEVGMLSRLLDPQDPALDPAGGTNGAAAANGKST